MICKIYNVPEKALWGKGFHLIIVHFFIQKVIEGYAEALLANFSNPWLQSFQLNGILYEIWQWNNNESISVFEFMKRCLWKVRRFFRFDTLAIAWIYKRCDDIFKGLE